MFSVCNESRQAVPIVQLLYVRTYTDGHGRQTFDDAALEINEVQ